MGRNKDVVKIMLFIKFIAGFLSGIIGGLGLGGGAVLLIYLRIFENSPQLKSQGINLLFFIPIGIVAVIIYFKKGLIELKTVLPLAAFGIIGALAGYFLTRIIGGEFLGKIFALVLIIMGSAEIIKVFLLKVKKKCGKMKIE